MRWFTTLPFILFLCCTIHFTAMGQGSTLSGKLSNSFGHAEYATIRLSPGNFSAVSDSLGGFEFSGLEAGDYKLRISRIGFTDINQLVKIKQNDTLFLEVEMVALAGSMNEVVVTGTLKEVKRMESPVPVEVYSPAFFKKNPTPNIFDALQNVNGVRPQLNCNVCNTGDIHINGLEGPYTMVLIDGMPIVSSLSTVYGLSGIPNSLVERIEIVKGPASSLYGSEAVGGLINIITKKPANAPLISADVFSTSWGEVNTDIGFRFKAGKTITALTGVNYFTYDQVMDNNKDNFTDVTLQDRVSLFQKWDFKRSAGRLFTIAGRYFNEDRWGGDTRWNKSFRGGDSIYGESIYTKRWELLGNYQLPMREKMLVSFSFNKHDQDSRYGQVAYLAQQRIAFAQITWDKTLRRHDLLSGVAVRHTYYDDNSIATSNLDGANQPQKIWLPGLFVQDEIALSNKHKLLAGLRYDYNTEHGNIFTPRLAYKWSVDQNNIIRVNAGTGFRVVNLFTEDHAALTGSRIVEIKNQLKPEKTYNVNLNYLKKMTTQNGIFIGLDLTAWYTYFNNRIISDYDTDPNKIIYANLEGYAQSKGISANTDVIFPMGLKVLLGMTFQDVSAVAAGRKSPQILTEKVTGTWALSYLVKPLHLTIDYTGNLYGPMRLPLLGSSDPRLPFSPTWSLQNIQLVYSGIRKIEIYGGLKNLLNFTPARGNPFIIARSHDPFDKKVEYDTNGKILVTPENPYGLSFDPTYMYAPNQGMRAFFGVRVNIKK